MQEALREAIEDAEWEVSDPDRLWREDAELRREVYPMLADLGETSQFLAIKRLVLNGERNGRCHHCDCKHWRTNSRDLVRS